MNPIERCTPFNLDNKYKILEITMRLLECWVRTLSAPWLFDTACLGWTRLLWSGFRFMLVWKVKKENELIRNYCNWSNCQLVWSEKILIGTKKEEDRNIERSLLGWGSKYTHRNYNRQRYDDYMLIESLVFWWEGNYSLI